MASTDMNSNLDINMDLDLKLALKKNTELELLLKLEKERFRTLANDTNCALWEYDIATKSVNQTRKLDGKWSKNNLVVENFRETILGWGLVHPDSIGVFEQYCNSMDNGDKDFMYDVRAINDDNTFAWFRYIGTTVYDDNGKPFKVIGKTLDVTKEKNEGAVSEVFDNIDPLTHLYTRVYAKEQIEKILNLAASSNSAHMLIIIDVDNFKSVNQQWGHLYGDYVLEAIATRLKGAFTFPAIFGRIGGDEFVVFIPNVENPDDAVNKISYRLQTRISSVFLKDDSHLTACLGIAVSPKHGSNYDSLFKCADIALYHAKKTNPSTALQYSRFVRYSTTVGETSRKRIDETASTDVSVKHLVNIEKNLFDYAFDIISADTDLFRAVHSIFIEAGKYFDLDRICIFEKDYILREVKMVDSWQRGNDKDSISDYLTVLYNRYWDRVEDRYFNNASYFQYSKDDILAPDDFFHRDPDFKMLNIYSILQFPIMDGAQLVGLINYEDRTKIHDWTDTEIATLSSITKIISSYMLRLRSKSELEDEILYTGNAMDSQKLTYYVINPETHIIKYISRYAKVLFPDIRVGEKCYKSVMGLNSPCSMCPALGLNNSVKQFSIETYSERYDAWFSTTASSVEKDGNVTEQLVCWTDVTAFLERVKAKDHLTGTLSFEKFKASTLKKLIENNDNYALVIIGIRHFSNINEEFGYRVGDEILKLASESLKNILHEDDLLCRIKGDDFIMLFNTSGEKILVIDRVMMACRSMEIMVREDYPTINIKCIGGVYYINESDYSITASIDKANLAKHKAGEFFSEDIHNFVTYDNDTENQMLEERAMEQAMTEALKQGQFHIFFQPKIDMKTDKIGGAEALVRWINPDGNFIPNYKFIPLFEKNGFIVELDKFVYNKTLEYMGEWIRQGKNVPLVSVNVSRLHLFDENFPDYLVELTEKYGVPRNLVEVEITESVFFDNIERLIEMISQLQSKGFVISMDDFGTGYSTLSLMKSLPIDILKIDGSFFMRSALDEKNKAIISSIIHLSKKLNLKIVSEGIETAEQVEFIKSEQCDFAQGFHYYKPIPAVEFAKLI